MLRLPATNNRMVCWPGLTRHLTAGKSVAAKAFHRAA